MVDTRPFKFSLVILYLLSLLSRSTLSQFLHVEIPDKITFSYFSFDGELLQSLKMIQNFGYPKPKVTNLLNGIVPSNRYLTLIISFLKVLQLFLLVLFESLSLAVQENIYLKGNFKCYIR